MDNWPPGGLDAEIADLQETHLPSINSYDIPGLLQDERLGRVALVSSFGAESIVLLHYASRILPGIEVLFLDTGKHFKETLAYRDQVAEQLNLNLRVLHPSQDNLSREDPYGALHINEPEACCRIRKVFPLQDVLGDYETWISGRKRYQASTRAGIPIVERDGTRIKVNPLALWTKEKIAAYIEEHALPPHPLEAQNYPSIGCAPCTQPVKPGEDPRSGRWAHSPDKVECGIHLGPDGRFSRSGQKKT